MTRQIFVGLFTEGTTDTRFLKPIMERTLENILTAECKGNFDFTIEEITITKTDKKFVEWVLEASKKGIADFGMTFLCVHTDADAKTKNNSYDTKINPAINALQQENDDTHCKIVIALVPVQEIEAWMLADTKCLKNELGTNESDTTLGIHKNPENQAKPKEVIENAIRIARQNLTKKRRNSLTIADLYLPIGQSLELKYLEKLDSYQDFKDNIRNALKSKNMF